MSNQKESAMREKSEKRMMEIVMLLNAEKCKTLQETFISTMDACGNNAVLAVKLLNVQCAAANVYIGELHREIDDLKELQKVSGK